MRHLYANPHNMEICCPSEIAQYIMTHPFDQDGPLFALNSYSRFANIFKSFSVKCKDAVKRLGVKIDKISVHSIRKGAATFVCSGTTAAPNIASVCIHAGWTMVKLQDVYLQYAEGGDQHVGRVVSGLPVLDVRFSCTQPFFKLDEDESPEADTCCAKDVDTYVDMIFPFTIRTSFRLVAIQFAACISLHFSKLEDELPPR